MSDRGHAQFGVMEGFGIEVNPDKQIGLAQKPDIRKVLHKGTDIEELDGDTKIITKDPEGLVQRNIVDKGILSTIGKKVTQGAKAAGEGLTKLGERVAGEGASKAGGAASDTARIIAPGSTQDVVGQAMKKIGTTISNNPEATAAAAGAGTIGYMAGGSGKRDPQYKEIEDGIETKGMLRDVAALTRQHIKQAKILETVGRAGQQSLDSAKASLARSQAMSPKLDAGMASLDRKVAALKKGVGDNVKTKGKFNLAGDRVARSLIGGGAGAVTGAAVGAATDPVDAIGGAKRGAIFGGVGGATGGLLAKVGAGGRAARHFGSTTRDTLKAEARRIPKAGLIGGIMGEAVLDKGISTKSALDDPGAFLENKIMRAAGKKAGGKLVGGALAIADKVKNTVSKGIETKTLRERIAKRVVDFAKPHLERIAEPTIQRVENAARGEVASQSAAMRPHIEAAARDEVAKQSARIRKDLVKEVGNKAKLATGIGAGAGAIVGGTAGALLGRKVQEKGLVGNAIKKLRGVAQSPFEGSVMQARQQAGRHLKKNIISSEERAARGRQKKLDDILSTTTEFNAAQGIKGIGSTAIKIGGGALAGGVVGHAIGKPDPKEAMKQRNADYFLGASHRHELGHEGFLKAHEKVIVSNDPRDRKFVEVPGSQSKKLEKEGKVGPRVGGKEASDYWKERARQIQEKGIEEKSIGSHLLAGGAGVVAGLGLAHEMNKPEESVSMRDKIKKTDEEHRKLGPPNFKNVHVPLKGQKSGKK